VHSIEESATELGISPEEAERVLTNARRKMLDARSKRIRPHLDDKVLTSWNGLMISAFARGGQVLGNEAFVETAARAADTLLAKGEVDGKLVRYLRSGKPVGRGVLEDYAFFEAGLIDLFEATSDEKWLVAAMELQEELDRSFWDSEKGGYFATHADQKDLLVREKNLDDGAIPCGNTIASMNLLRLHSLTTDDAYLERVEALMKAFSRRITQSPTTASKMLLALDYYFDTAKEILIIAPKSRSQTLAFVEELNGVFLPNHIRVAVSQAEAEELAERVPLLKGKKALDGKVTAYVCENQTCERPVTTLVDFRAQLRDSRKAWEKGEGKPVQSPVPAPP